jgi:ribonuclease HI
LEKKWLETWSTNGWKTASKSNVENQDLWKELLVLLQHHDVKFHKVKGHADNEFNNRCDKLAREAAQKVISDKKS